MDTARLAAGSLGPRLAGRLTAELILRSPQYMNCVKEYEIDLRGACGAALRKQARMLLLMASVRAARLHQIVWWPQ